MIELEIDGKKTTVEEGTTIIQAADEMGIYIPRFCYHKKLSVAANCRMCLVEVDKVGKALPACATPVNQNMKVFTQSKKTTDAQRMVMEYLLINHPLDCPICDQGGECELQDLAMGFGRACSNYEEKKRAVFSEDIGPLVETEMTRCIQCTRCVRFGEEIAGLRELGVLNRGEHEEISTYVKHFLQSELSGNIIDLCPVGALTDKPARYKGRGWEYREHPFISPHDCVGTNMFVHSRSKEYMPQRVVMRAVPRENESINENWMSDRDRYAHFGLYHDTRLYRPKIKRNEQWETVSWEEALDEVARRLQSVIDQHGSEQIGALISPSATVEESYLLQKLMRSLGSNNIDHRIRWQDFTDQDQMVTPHMTMRPADIQRLNTILLIGSNVRFEQPMISHHMNQAFLEGAKILAVNSMDYPFIFGLENKMIVSPTKLISALMGIAKALGSTESVLASVTVDETAQAFAKLLQTENAKGIFLGETALQHPQAAQIRAWAQHISDLCGASVNLLTEGANSVGAWLAGAIPHRSAAGASVEQKGLTAFEMLTTKPLKAYCLFNIEPELDCVYPASALKALRQADCVVAFTTFVNPAMERMADILLPLAPFTETAGTFVNAAGCWQSFLPVSEPLPESQPGWKIVRLLANFFDLPEFEYETAQAVHQELEKAVEQMPKATVSKRALTAATPSSTLTRLAPWPMYRVDSLVRRSWPLQQVFMQENPAVLMNTQTAARYQLQSAERVVVVQQDQRLEMPLKLDDRLADDTVYLPSGLEETAGFGQAQAAITVERVIE